jgi:hypothetical protein
MLNHFQSESVPAGAHGGNIAQGAMHDKNFLPETDAKRLM